MVAMLGPFIDTRGGSATMTALVVIVSGAYAEPAAGEGVEMTRWAFADTFSWFPPVILTSRSFCLPTRR
jgi:Na+/alanine symporter